MVCTVKGDIKYDSSSNESKNDEEADETNGNKNTGAYWSKRSNNKTK